MVRVKAIAIVRRGDAVLLSFAIDPATGRRYGRFLGGGVEPGERARDAVVREWREELEVELTGVEQRGVVENTFTHDGEVFREVIVVFDAQLADDTLYAREFFPVNERVCDGPAEWVAIERLTGGEIAVYPADLLTFLS